MIELLNNIYLFSVIIGLLLTLSAGVIGFFTLIMAFIRANECKLKVVKWGARAGCCISIVYVIQLFIAALVQLLQLLMKLILVA